MRIFNKFVESKKEPSNKNDIWFDGEIARIYKEEEWQDITASLKTINQLKSYIDAFEVKQNGDVYIKGIGGFTGTNSDSSKSVQEVINELVNKLNEITTND